MFIRYFLPYKNTVIIHGIKYTVFYGYNFFHNKKMFTSIRKHANPTKKAEKKETVSDITNTPNEKKKAEKNAKKNKVNESKETDEGKKKAEIRKRKQKTPQSIHKSKSRVRKNYSFYYFFF